jgi:hypothetical protein
MGYSEGKLQRNEALLRALGQLEPIEEPPEESEGKVNFDGGEAEIAYTNGNEYGGCASMLRLGSLNFAKPLGEGCQHPATHDRDALDQLRELTGAEHEESHLALGGDRGGARRRVKESHLAEAVAGAEIGAPLTADRRLSSTIGDHESLSPRVALAHQHSAGGDLYLLGEDCDAGEVALAAGREELDLREPFNLGVARPPSSRSPHRQRVSQAFRARWSLKCVRTLGVTGGMHPLRRSRDRRSGSV